MRIITLCLANKRCEYETGQIAGFNHPASRVSELVVQLSKKL